MLAKRFSRQDDFDAEINAAARRYGVEAALVKAVIARESGFKPDALNQSDPGGAWGLMQVIEGTARWLGHTGPMQELFEPSVGINLGTKYLGLQRLKYPVLADTVAAYNAGSPRTTASGAYVNQPYVNGVLDWLAYFRAYAAERGGAAPDAAPFPDADPGGPGGPVASDPAPEGVEPPDPWESPQRPGERPRMRWPLVGVVTGAGLWAALYFATCGG